MMRSNTVAEIDEVAKTFERLPDRPDPKFYVRPRKDVAKAKALNRLRNRVWRQSNDRRGRPTSAQLGAALLYAVCMHEDFASLIESDLSIVRSAVNDLCRRGCRIEEVEDMLRKIRRRRIPASDRSGTP
jgi:hypothetical protein